MLGHVIEDLGNLRKGNTIQLLKGEPNIFFIKMKHKSIRMVLLKNVEDLVLIKALKYR